jgi:hypothetical protein
MTRSMLSARETQALLLIGCYRYLTRKQMEEFLLADTTTTPLSREVITRRIVRRLAVQGLVADSGRLVGGRGGGSIGLAYHLTAAGSRFAATLEAGQPQRRPAPKGTFLLQHALMTADFALALRRAATLRRDEILEWECDWQAAQKLGLSVVVPDAHFVYATRSHELEALLEIDLGTEGTQFFARKVARYIELFRSGTWQRRFPIWPVVLIVAPTDLRVASIKRAAETVFERQGDPEKLSKQMEFWFAAQPRVIADSPLARIWSVAGCKAERALLEDHLE